MRFKDGHIRLSSEEVVMGALCWTIAVVASIFTFGLTVALAMVLSVAYVHVQREQEEKMMQLATSYSSSLEELALTIEYLRTYEEYLPRVDSERLQEPFLKIAEKLRALPEEYEDLWSPIKKECNRSLRFLHRYNRQYLHISRERHQDFFSGRVYHNGYGFNEEQIDAILTNDYSNLVVAGPGAGKTRVLTSRVAFFVKKKQIAEERILVLTFNNSAAEEVRTRLKERFEIKNVDVSTFHSLGLRILRGSGGVGRNAILDRIEHVKKEIIDQLRESDEEFGGLFLWHQTIWGKGEKDARHTDEQFDAIAHESYTAIDGTSVKSLAERDIANFFIRHGIRYEYEKNVDWCDSDPEDPKRTYCPDFYLPDYDVYIEHWSVTEDGTTPPFYTAEESERYRKSMGWKREQFEKHNKVLWETNHTMFAQGTLRSELESRLLSIGARLSQLSYRELLETAGLDDSPSGRVSEAIMNALTAAKTYGLTPDSLAERVRGQDVRSKQAHLESVFILDLVIPVFGVYEDYLREKNKIDFEDMINKAVRILDGADNDGPNSIVGAYEHIMVDEFQDISFQRLQLLKNIHKLNPGSRLFCVGDDWQAIYGFAGSSSKYMIRFGDHFRQHERVDLVQNYRNPSDILEFCSLTIDRCKEKLNKKLIPIDDGEDTSQTPVMVHSISAGDEWEFKREQNKIVFNRIKDLLKQGLKSSQILVLSRFNHGLADLRQMCEDSQEIPVQLTKNGKIVRNGVKFMTVHKSKGLEADYVFLLNVSEGLYGFPPNFVGGMEFRVIHEDLPDPEDEERRLFFVAVTRARRECNIFVQRERKSKFLTENEWYLSHYCPRLKRTFQGRIVDEREKAYEIEVILSKYTNHKIWVPKSVIYTLSDDGDGVKTFMLEEWWFKREAENKGKEC
ncbi:MAG: hypothetical protein DRP09_14325 [Candidatus Thorarchaeota archaeon]|nr:MAG: hypothetical protein DRP09_14325 [Candidatus Thorarchaeota archaeon]